MGLVANRRAPLTLLAAVLVTLTGGAVDARAVRSAGPVQAVTSQRVYAVAAAYGSRRDEYLVAYLREPNDPEREPSTTVVQRLGRSGAPVGGATEVASHASGTGPLGQALAYDSRRNEFLVVWQAIAAPPPAFDYELRGRRLSATGAPIGAPRTLLSLAEQAKWHVRCCGEFIVRTNRRGPGYLLAWRAERGRVLGPGAVMGRALEGNLARAPVRRLSSRTGATRFDVAPDPLADGYLLAAWASRPDGSALALITDRLTRAGRRRGAAATVTRERGGLVALGADERNGGYAVAWRRPSRMNIRRLDRAGRPSGDLSTLRPHGRFNDMSPTAVSYNHPAGEFVVAWHGSYQADDDRYFDETTLRSLDAETAAPFGPTFLPKGEFGPLLVSSTREARWLVLSANGPLYAQPVRP